MRDREEMLHDFAEIWNLCYGYDPVDGTVECRQCRIAASRDRILFPHRSPCAVGRLEADLRGLQAKESGEGLGVANGAL